MATPASKNRRPPATPSTSRGTLYPLDTVYRRAGIEVPRWRLVTPDEIPAPYRSLLVHESDMTSTLERHCGGTVVLRALGTFTSGAWYFRRVLLVQEHSGRPVEMGAIRIKLDAFGTRLKRQILKNEVPLGRLLRESRFDYMSHAKAFVALTPNPEMMGVFWMREPRTLYGRRTEISSDGRKIGDIVEVLPLV
jgi:chorismate-pyruvate lyase